MKHLRINLRGALLGSALALGASVAPAAPPGTVTTSQQPTWLTGSDTLNKVMDTLLNGNATIGVTGMLTDGTLNNSATGIKIYNGTGSGNGEGQLTGTTSQAGTAQQPACLVGGAADTDGAPDTNPGCQEISPMSRPMQSAICDDEESAGKAEGLAVCADGLVVITNNAAHQRVADTAADCSASVTSTPNNDTDADGFPEFPDRKTGKLRFAGNITDSTGATVYTITDWKDTLRLVYTGCKNGGGDTCTTQPARATRCNDTVRRELVSKWTNLFDGADCGTGACATGLRQAYRRDDSSGTTAVFLEVLGVKLPLITSSSGPNNGQRKSVVQGPGGSTLTAIPDNFPFCDGGLLEAYFPAPSDAAVGGATSDPIHTPCSTAPVTTPPTDIAGADDLCLANGTLPLVRAIRTPPATGAFNTKQCTKGNFAKVFSSAWNSSRPICPDGTVPAGGACRLPFLAIDRNGDGDKTDVGDRDFDCMNTSVSQDPKWNVAVQGPAPDGRVYNFVKRDADGVVAVQSLDATRPPVIDVPQWRQNMTMFNLTLAGNTGGTFPASAAVCQSVDSTQLQGCLVAKTTCAFGWGGREQASTDPFDDEQEPVKLNNATPSNASIASLAYPFSRNLYVNAIGGFENITLDCVDRGGATDYCEDQVALANEFYAMSARVRASCTLAGFIPLATAVCEGSNYLDGSIPGAGCGAPKSQLLTACQPL